MVPDLGRPGLEQGRIRYGPACLKTMQEVTRAVKYVCTEHPWPTRTRDAHDWVKRRFVESDIWVGPEVLGFLFLISFFYFEIILESQKKL